MSPCDLDTTPIVVTTATITIVVIIIIKPYYYQLPRFNNSNTLQPTTALCNPKDLIATLRQMHLAVIVTSRLLRLL
jgi:hypothetical protein